MESLPQSAHAILTMSAPIPVTNRLGSVIWSQVLPAAYKLRNISIDFNQVTTNNKVPPRPIAVIHGCRISGSWNECWISADTSWGFLLTKCA